jgi:shikimate dehydrogenase
LTATLSLPGKSEPHNNPGLIRDAGAATRKPRKPQDPRAAVLGFVIPMAQPAREAFSMTDRYVVIGNPIEHSMSPRIHAQFARATGQDIDYQRLLAPLDGFARAVDAFRAGAGRGASVTMPFKTQACAGATDPSERARLAGAANALKFEGERIYAENFDGVGLMRDIRDNLGQALAGKRVLLLGAGGAARGLLHSCLQERPAELVIANRDAERARALARTCADHGAVAVAGGGYDDIPRERFDIVLNATSTGLSGDGLPLPAPIFGPRTLAYELFYGRGLTPFLRQARAAGAGRLADGVGMLVEQAAEAFAWWRGVRPRTRPVIASLSVPLK